MKSIGFKDIIDRKPEKCKMNNDHKETKEEEK